MRGFVPSGLSTRAKIPSVSRSVSVKEKLSATAITRTDVLHGSPLVVLMRNVTFSSAGVWSISKSVISVTDFFVRATAVLCVVALGSKSSKEGMGTIVAKQVVGGAMFSRCRLSRPLVGGVIG